MTMPFPVLDAAEAKKRLDEVEPEALIDGLRTAFAGLKTGSSVQPMTTIIDYPGEQGDCVFLAGLQWELDLVGVKLSPFVKERIERGLDPVTAYTLLLSARTGEPLLMCDSLALTAARTGATTALGVDYLAAPSAKALAVVGASKVAIEHIRHVAHLRDWESVKVHSPALSEESSQRRADFESQREGLEMLLGASIDIVDSVDAAVGAADVIMGCTSANEWFIDADRIKPDALVTSVSSDVKPAHEIRPDQLNRYSVFCDYLLTATTKSWEMKQAVELGVWSMDSIVADLPRLATEDVTIDFGSLRYFRNHGVAIEDLVVGSLILQR